MKTALKHKGKWICVTCFNKLSDLERQGRGAREAGWMANPVNHTCCKCKQVCQSDKTIKQKERK